MKNKPANNSQNPVCRDSGFLFSDIESLKKAFSDEKKHPHEPENYIYSRYRNPTIVAVEKELAKLEGCKWTLLAESGMAAIDIALSIFQKGDNTGKWLFFNEIYGGTNSFIDLVLKARRGIDIHRFTAEENGYSLVKLKNLVGELKPEIVYFEVVSNPMLIVADVEEIIKISKSIGAKVIIDNTFLTPLLLKPLQLGADLVIHSVTKYLAGHGNITAGVVCGNKSAFCEETIEYRKWAGHFFSPDDASRLSSFLKSFIIRFEKHISNAQKLAQTLVNHKNIEKVLYPGLPSHPSHLIAKTLFGDKGYGGMITFDIKGNSREQKTKRCKKFINLVSDKIAMIPTLGDADTILLPIEAVWGEKYPYPGMIRLSVGIEDYLEIEHTITTALDQL